MKKPKIKILLKLNKFQTCLTITRKPKNNIRQIKLRKSYLKHPKNISLLRKTKMLLVKQKKFQINNKFQENKKLLLKAILKGSIKNAKNYSLKK